MIKKLLTTLLVAGILLTPSVSFATAPHFQVDTGGTLTTNLQAYYKLEDTTDFWGTNNGTAASGATATSTGKVNGSYNFDGSTNAYIDLGNPTALQWNNTDGFSVGGWIKTSGSPTDDIFAGYLGNTQPGNPNVQLRILSGKLYINWSADNTTGYTGTGSTTINDNVWHFILFTYDGNKNVKGYVDGNTTPEISFTATNVTGNFTTGNWAIGASYSALGTFSPTVGLIDEVGFWKKALSTTEITDLYNGGNGQTMVVTTALAPMQVLWIGY